MKKTKIILLGHTGFIGSSLLRSFNKMGFLNVLGLSSDDINLLEGSASVELAKHINEECILVVCSFIKRQVGDVLDTYQKNITLISNIAKAVNLSKPSKVIFISSSAVYGEDIPRERPITEVTIPEPVSYYGLSKLHSEQLLQQALGSSLKDKLLILRPTTVYGELNKKNYDPTGFVYKAKEGCIELWGDGEEKRDFIYIDDFCKIVFDLMQRGGVFGILNIVTGKSISFRKVVDHLKQEMNMDFSILSKPRSKRKVDHYYDSSKLCSLCPNLSFMKYNDALSNFISKECL